MRRQDFVELLGRLEELTPQQKAAVIRHLDDGKAPENVLVAGKLPGPTRCPHCEASKDRFVSWGQSHMGSGGTAVKTVAAPSMP